MSRTRRLLIVAAILVIAALMAFPLRETIYDAVVVPIAFIAWQLGLVYRSLAQVIWWWLIIVVVLFMLAFSLMPQVKPVRKEERRSKPNKGQVEDLAIWLGRAKSGVYFKWLIANRLGKLAYHILLHRESGRPRTVFTPLLGTDWEPSRELQNYLEIGLHGSFSDFPNPNPRLAAQPKTPLDYEVRQAVEFLESKVENGGRSGISKFPPGGVE
jgi:hypothetical protein